MPFHDINKSQLSDYTILTAPTAEIVSIKSTGEVVLKIDSNTAAWIAEYLSNANGKPVLLLRGNTYYKPSDYVAPNVECELVRVIAG